MALSHAQVSRLKLPESFLREVEQDRERIIRQVDNVEAVCASFNKELKKIDPHLRMVRAKDQTSPSSPLKAGYYHVIRDAPGHPSYVTPLEWADGSYREPGDWVFEHLQHEDLWNDRATKAKRKRDRDLEAARKRQKDRDSLARAREYDERVSHALNGRISVPSRPW